MKKQEIDLALKKRRLAIDNLQRLADYLKQGITCPVKLQTRADHLQGILNAFESQQAELEVHDSDDHSQARVDFENVYFDTKAEFAIQIKALQPAVPVAQSQERTGTTTAIKLPTIEIPKFSGDYTQWRHFQDTFNSLVIGNKALSDVQRHQYLLCNLTGDARQLIEGVPITDANFRGAWEAVCERYDNPRLIADRHVRALMDLPQARKGNPQSLHTLLSRASAHLTALKALDIKVPLHELFVSHMVLERVEPQLAREWETSVREESFSPLKELFKFLETRCQALVLTQHKPEPEVSKPGFKGTRQAFIATSQGCPHCSGNHPVYRCAGFREASAAHKEATVNKHRLCFNCLGNDHGREQCPSSSCRTCGERHHTLLHRHQKRNDKSVASGHQNPGSSAKPGQPDGYCALEALAETQILLATAQVDVRDIHGRFRSCRVLLDSGAQSNLATQGFARKLGLHGKPKSMQVEGIGGATVRSSHSINLQLSSQCTDFTTRAEFSVLPHITGQLPARALDSSTWGLPTDIRLADLEFHRPGPIDLVLGSELFFLVLRSGKRVRSSQYPILQETELGWVLSGNTGQPTWSGPKAFISINDPLQEQLQRLWQLDQPTAVTGTKEEKQCEAHFVAHTRRDDTGRYVVRLPLLAPSRELGESRHVALSRLHGIERRLARDPALAAQYSSFLDEYEQLGHMIKAEPPTDVRGVYYLPHHPVVRESSSTTRVRVVFDASCKTTSGRSLNDILMVGPQVQEDLNDIFIRFRTYPICFTADVEKMFRQVSVDPEDRDLQRILWRRSTSDPVQEYQLTTVTYGTASAPYLSTRCLRALAESERNHVPKASATLLQGCYVDDILSGGENLQEAQELQQELQQLLSSGGFHLRKWTSNCADFIKAVPPEERGLNSQEEFLTQHVKTLGLVWRPSSDKLRIAAATIDSTAVQSKRRVLATVASVFDPLGLISPVVIAPKILLQRLWKAGISWDEELSGKLLQQWRSLLDQLPKVADIQIPRHVQTRATTACEIHGFSDASEKAYGACLYVKTLSAQGEIVSNLLCSRSRVAPLKTTSIPRLELCAALLLARLLTKTVPALCLNVTQTTLWTDSSVVLAWLAAEPSRWQTFVANRVAEIQEHTPNAAWHHIRSQDNPADLISRGVNPTHLADSDTWWHGPEWLTQPPEQWPESAVPQLTTMPEERSEQVRGLVARQDCSLISRYSEFRKLRRIVAWCTRFVKNCRSRMRDKSTRPHHPQETHGLRQGVQTAPPLTAQELHNATLACVRVVQQAEFAPELEALRRGQNVTNKSPLYSLNPFIDGVGTLRVGGRLENSKLPFETRHPRILPSRNHLTQLIISDEHIRMKHANPQLLQSSLKAQYWILRARQAVRAVCNHCQLCARQRAKGAQQLMGSLPTGRVQPSRTFAHTGLDLAGPLKLKTGTTRSKSTTKAYVVVFVCLATRAVHLELVSDLTTAAFIAALWRYVSRRGVPSDIYADNGRNIVGARNQLTRDYKQFFSNKEHWMSVERHAAECGITWHHSPPLGAHFGGIWEAAVKSMKGHLRTAVGSSLLTFEEMYTLLSQIEACLNSRPLFAIPESSEASYLTPGHFLVGQPVSTIPEPSLLAVNGSRLSRWQRVQKMSQQFWGQWSRVYLHTLQQRTKWAGVRPNIAVGSLVLLMEEARPPLTWPKGIVETVHPGADGLVRVVTVRTARGTFRRPITKVCVLPVGDSMSGHSQPK